MVPPLGAPIGFIAAIGCFLLLGLGLSDEQFRAWGWRLPFLASAVLVMLGLWVRLKLTETPAFLAAARAETLPRVPIATLIKRHLRAPLAGTFAVVACFALFYLATAFALGYGTKELGYPRETFLAIELLAILFLAAGIIVSCVSAARSGATRILMLGCAGCLVSGV